MKGNYLYDILDIRAAESSVCASIYGCIETFVAESCYHGMSAYIYISFSIKRKIVFKRVYFTSIITVSEYY